MRRILLKTVPVNLRREWGTYLLMGILVAVGMYIASTFAGITYSYSRGCEENFRVSNTEDGQFQVTEPLSPQEEQAITEKGYTLERAFYFDTDQEDGSVLRVMKTRESIDRIVLDEGTLPQSDTEAVLEKCYAYHHALYLSDTIPLANARVRISGIGSVTDYDSPSAGMNDYSSNSKAFGLVFVTRECYQSLLEAYGEDTKETCVYAYKLAAGASDEDLRRVLVEQLHLLPRLVTFVPVENNNRMNSAKDDNAAYGVVGMITGIGLLILISMVFFLRIQFSLDKQSPSIGALLAMGVERSDIFPILLLPFALVAFSGGLAGFIFSRIFPLDSVAGSTGYYSIPHIPMITHPLIFLYCVVMPPLVCTIINLLLIQKKLAQPVVSLLRSSNESTGRSTGIIAAMVVGSLMAATIFMIGRGVGLYCTTVKEKLPEEIHYSNVYELSEEHTQVPPLSQGAFRHVFSVEDHGYIRDIQFIGIESGPSFFDVQVAGLDGGVVISSAVASRYGLHTGDTLSVFDSLTREAYEFEIKGVTNYNVLLTVFMDIGDLRSLLNKEGIAYNMVYADKELDFKKNQLFSAATKEDLIAPVEMLEPEVQSSRDIFCALAVLFYGVVMIYLIQFAVVRSRKDIACLSAFGYGSGKLIQFVTGKLIVLACVSAAVSLFVAYRFSLALMPSLIASTPIGLMIDYRLPEYLLHLAGAFGIILVSILLGMKRVDDTDTLFYLRSRE